MLDFERLKAAAEDAAWLCARGYAAAAVAEFVAAERGLGDRERRVLACAARADAHHRHHIARELDPEDIERRPIRLDVRSVVATVVAALRAAKGGVLLIESAAGLVCDPEPAAATSEQTGDASRRIAAAVAGLAPSAVRLVYAAGDEEICAPIAAALAASKRKLKVEREVVANVADRLRGAAGVASADPAVLDECGTWINLAGMIAREIGAPTLRLG